MATTYTRTLRLRKPDFRDNPWADDVNANMDDVDSSIANALRIAGVEPWEHSTLYEVGRFVIDTDVSPVTYWICNVEHTSGGMGLFATYRQYNPTHWSRVPFGITVRGEWANDTEYDYFDLVYDPVLGITGLCKVGHTSSSAPNTIQDDVENWDFLVDLPSMGVVQAINVSFSNTTAGLPGPPTNVQTALDALDALTDSLGSGLTTLDALVDTTVTAVDAAEVTIASHTGTLTSLDTRLDSAEADIDDLQTRMTQAEADILAMTGAFDAGTAMLFWQATAPTGWTKSTTHNDKALRVVSGATGGGNGGSVAFSTVFGRYQVDGHTIDSNELTYHAHTFSDYYQSGSLSDYSFDLAAGSNRASKTITNTGNYTGGTTAYAGASTAHVHGCEMRVAYLDLIICTKNA